MVRFPVSPHPAKGFRAWMIRPRYSPCPAAERSEASYGSLAWRCAAPIALNQAGRGRQAAVLALRPQKSSLAAGNTTSANIHGMGSNDAAHVQPW
jgi:hypothetical protein